MEGELLYEHVVESGFLRDVKLVDCGREQCVAGKKTEGEVVGIICIHAIVSGKGVFEYDGKKVELQAGDIFALMPGVVYKHYPDDDKPWLYFWVNVRSAMTKEVLNNVGITNSHPYLRLDKKLKMSEHIERIVFNYERRGHFSFSDLGSFYMFLEAMTSNFDVKHNIVSREESFVKRAIRFIGYNKPDVKVEEIALNLGIHPNYFTAIFKKTMGISPKQYLVRRRMEMAKRMILVDKIKIKQVSENLGYSNQLQFSKEFKKYFGCCPSKFQE